MSGAGLITNAYGNFFISGDEKMKFFNEWFIELRAYRFLFILPLMIIRARVEAKVKA